MRNRVMVGLCALLLSLAGPTAAEEPEMPQVRSGDYLSPEPEPMPNMANLAGSWTVTSTETAMNTCTMGTSPGSVTAYQWIISTTPYGAVTVAVQGKTIFPNLTGFFNGTKLTLTGNGTPTGNWMPSSWFELTMAKGELIGQRRYLGFQTTIISEGLAAMTPCFVDFTLKAKHL